MGGDYVYLESPILSPLDLLPLVTSLFHCFIIPSRPGAEVNVCPLLFSPEPSISQYGPSITSSPCTLYPNATFPFLVHLPVPVVRTNIPSQLPLAYLVTADVLAVSTSNRPLSFPQRPSAATNPPTQMPSFLFSTPSNSPHILKVMGSPN
jgi:hypothetical protein